MPSTNGHGPRRAILYARVSTDEQARSGYSLAQQIEALRAYAAQEGYEVLEEVVDPGQSGASLERPGMDRVRDLVAAGGASVVLAQDRDRFSREPAYTYLLRREFEERGTKLRALNDRGDDSPEGQLTDGILDQLAKYERAKVMERSRRGRLRKAREGKLIVNGRANYGLKHNEVGDGYEVYQPEMLVVHRIFRSVANGVSLYGIKRALEIEGVPPPGNSSRGANTGTLRICGSSCRTTCTPRTTTRRSSRWWHRRSRRGSTGRSATGSTGTTAPAPPARGSLPTAQKAASTSGATLSIKPPRGVDRHTHTGGRGPTRARRSRPRDDSRQPGPWQRRATRLAVAQQVRALLRLRNLYDPIRLGGRWAHLRLLQMRSPRPAG
jgi:DNA invertase Pin-like site-specific DNA recombinase